MTKDLQIFDFEEQAVRVSMIEGAPWFVAKDVCGVLGLSNTSKALQALDDDEKTIVKTRDGVTNSYTISEDGICNTYTVSEGEPILSDSLGRSQDFSLVSESGFYALVLKSRKPEAKRVRKWVTSEVLPAIRKTGKYFVSSQGEDETINLASNASDIELLSSTQLNSAFAALKEVRSLFGDRAARHFYSQIPGMPSMAQFQIQIDAQSGGESAVNSQIDQFVSECLEHAPGKVVQAQRLYDAYKCWAEFEGYSPMSSAKFGGTVHKTGIRKSFGRIRYYQDVALKPGLLPAPFGAEKSMHRGLQGSHIATYYIKEN